MRRVYLFDEENVFKHQMCARKGLLIVVGDRVNLLPAPGFLDTCWRDTLPSPRKQRASGTTQTLVIASVS